MSTLTDTPQEEPLFKKRSTKKSIRKRAATPPPISSSEEEYSSQDESGRQIKRRRKTRTIGASSTTHRAAPVDETILDGPLHTSTLSSTLATVNDATKHSDWFESDSTNSKSLLGTTRALPSSTAGGPDGIYKGATSYSSFISKNPNAQTTISKLMGPQKPSSNVRMVTTTDFAPDVCKDYKQTGFCGFGDSCKFLHAREDYKQGWQLDKEWESVSKGKTLNGTVVSKRGVEMLDEDEDEEDVRLLETIPFKCVICKEDYKNPITTRCGHYFCEGCALKRYRKSTACAICGEDTRGVFNGAKTLKKILERKKERERRIREKRREEGEEVSDTEKE